MGKKMLIFLGGALSFSLILTVFFSYLEIKAAIEAGKPQSYPSGYFDPVDAQPDFPSYYDYDPSAYTSDSASSIDSQPSSAGTSRSSSLPSSKNSSASSSKSSSSVPSSPSQSPSSSVSSTASSAPPASSSAVSLYDTAILGSSVATADQLVNYVVMKLGGNISGIQLNCSLYELAEYFLEEGGAEGVRGDIAFCQSIKETGWFRFGGSVLPSSNNYCGLGAIDGSSGGEHFSTPQIGVRAQIQHLLGYASTRLPGQTLVDTRFNYINPRGCAPKWLDLAGKWAVPGYDTAKYASLSAAIAANDTYSHVILNHYRDMLAASINPAYVNLAKTRP